MYKHNLSLLLSPTPKRCHQSPSQNHFCNTDYILMYLRFEEAEANYHGCYGIVVFDSSDAVRVRSGEPVAAADGIGAYRRHDPRHLCQPLFHSAGILVYLQETGRESITARNGVLTGYGILYLAVIKDLKKLPHICL